ncbi:ribosome maturation factor RimP [Roseofilum sp. BLCC_M154]|uniref:Ribosome maturation factor RimP n=1 Tax=Roseofilum acuticapitatum BLCC-M154 TaxID=3022444 RepID=A0ABT7AWQ9_9CYAN|nr:ribosome maturation factor RimP [Roseofilum acuticapitatum]MDJ1171343.1 ribosome maturation factor RimP [Roseofilum acuticapitatum BLCC-M154]
MVHPLIPQILELATPVAQKLGLEVVGATFQTNQNPPVLRVDIRNPSQDTGLDECEQMSHLLDIALEESQLITQSYVLEISSPGISKRLTTDRDFIAFKGFPAIVMTDPPYKEKSQWQGTLNGRDETTVYLNQKGRNIAIPRDVILWVEFC